MRKLMTAIAILVVSACGTHNETAHTLKGGASTLELVENLDGKKFCRTIVSDGLFGQPAGERTHCISFAAGIMMDDANTFFGNPPEAVPYRISNNAIEVNYDGQWVSSAYRIDGDTIKNDVGAVLKLQR